MEGKIKVGDTVRFYDCDQANKDKDYSGKDPKYYPLGEVIAVYEKGSMFGNTNKLCDIKLTDGRISKGHFVEGVKLKV